MVNGGRFRHLAGVVVVVALRANKLFAEGSTGVKGWSYLLVKQ